MPQAKAKALAPLVVLLVSGARFNLGRDCRFCRRDGVPCKKRNEEGWGNAMQKKTQAKTYLMCIRSVLAATADRHRYRASSTSPGV